MQSWLSSNTALAGATANCYATEPFKSKQPVHTSVAATQSPAGALTTGALCNKQATSPTTLYLKWNMFSSEWGGYEVDGCAGVNPKLQLTAGTTYTFDQSNASNWYHPVGFAYIAGGAHSECVATDGAKGECPELGGETGKSTLQYFVDGKAVTNDESGFGLDAYEPLFFNSQDWWSTRNTANAYKVTLTIPADASFTTFYYFCHIHAGMSAEVQVVGSSYAGSATAINAAVLGKETQASALAIYTAIKASEQKTVATFDATCGTHASAAFDPKSKHSTCDGKTFLCGPGSSGTYETCLTAIDCQMHHDMAVSVPAGKSKFATFARQMIPHHQNAVAMAKALAKHHTAADYPAAGTEDQDKAWAEGLIMSIINLQNFQIQQMQSWLSSNTALAGDSSSCYGSSSLPAKVQLANMQKFTWNAKTAVWTKPPKSAGKAAIKAARKAAKKAAKSAHKKKKRKLRRAAMRQAGRQVTG
jgi:uncharacterized protein (DUF305 family)